MNAKETAEETTAEDVFSDDFGKGFTDGSWMYIAANSNKGLKVELEEQPRAQLSLLPLPYPRRSAERATQGRGSSQAIASTCDLTSLAPANANSSPCNNEFLAFEDAGLLDN